MSDRAFMKCPLCRDAGNPNPPELMRDAHMFNCPMGHSIPQERLSVLNPEKIKMQVVFRPGVNDVKSEFWCNQEVLQRAKEALGERFHKTIESILRTAMTGEYILIDGQQAAELRKLGIRNGAEMVATAKQNLELVGQNESLTAEVTKWETRIAEAMTGAGA